MLNQLRCGRINYSTGFGPILEGAEIVDTLVAYIPQDLAARADLLWNSGLW